MSALESEVRKKIIEFQSASDRRLAWFRLSQTSGELPVLRRCTDVEKTCTASTESTGRFKRKFPLAGSAALSPLTSKALCCSLAL